MSRKQVKRVLGERLFGQLRYVAAAHGMKGPEEALRQIVKAWVGPDPYSRYTREHFQQVAATMRARKAEAAAN